jgi:hypothetical protein
MLMPHNYICIKLLLSMGAVNHTHMYTTEGTVTLIIHITVILLTAPIVKAILIVVQGF